MGIVDAQNMVAILTPKINHYNTQPFSDYRPFIIAVLSTLGKMGKSFLAHRQSDPLLGDSKGWGIWHKRQCKALPLRGKVLYSSLIQVSCTVQYRGTERYREWYLSFHP